MQNKKLKIEIWSDVVCPYCFIGKRHFDAALAQFPHRDDLDIAWKSFELHPDYAKPDGLTSETVVEGLARTNHISVEKAQKMVTVVTEMAKKAGLAFRFDRAIAANTHQAHALLQVAKEKGLSDKGEETLFAAHFIDGLDVGDKEVLRELGRQIGLSDDEIERAFNDEALSYAVRQDCQQAANMQIDTVPTFIFNNRYGIVGAEPVELFLETLHKAYDAWQKDEQQPIERSQGASCSLDGTC